jgi:hypothetical protein
MENEAEVLIRLDVQRAVVWNAHLDLCDPADKSGRPSAVFTGRVAVRSTSPSWSILHEGVDTLSWNANHESVDTLTGAVL